MKVGLEKQVVSRTMKALRAIGAKVIKTHGDIFLPAGTPDLIGCFRGRAFAFECKNEVGRVTIIQEKELAEWSASGAITAVVRDPKEAIKALENGFSGETVC